MGKVNIKQLNVAPASGYVIGSGAGGVPIWKLESSSVDWSNITGNQAVINLSGFTNDSGFITGNQTITLSGDVAGSGTTGITTTIANNAVTNAKFRQSFGISVIGNPSVASGNVQDITATNNDQVLRVVGSVLGFGLLNLASTSITTNRIPYGVSSVLSSSVNFTYNGTDFSVNSGTINALTGYKINNSAPSGQYLRGNGTNFVSSALTASDLAANSITDGLIRQSAGLSVIGRSANSTGNVADITAGTDGHVLRRSGTSIGFGLLTGSSISATNNQFVFGSGGVYSQSANAAYDGTTVTFTSGFNSVSNIQSGVNYSGTSTGTADGAYGVRYSHILTANNSANHSVTGVRFAPTLVAASNFNKLNGVVIDPTFTNGAFTSVINIPLQIVERTADGQSIRIQHDSASNTGGLTINDNLNTQRAWISYQGSTGHTFISLAGSSQNRFNYSNSNLLIQNAFQTRATYVNGTGHYSHTPLGSTSTSGTAIAHNLFQNFAPTSGTGIHNWLQIDGVINQTGGANGITRGLYLNHTLTAAADYRAIEVASGKTKVRDIEIGAADAFYLGDPTTDGTWRIIRSGNDLLSQRRESGFYVTKQTITP